MLFEGIKIKQQEGKKTRKEKKLWQKVFGARRTDQYYYHRSETANHSMCEVCKRNKKWASWCSDTFVDLYAGDAWYKSWPGHWLF
jgi:hypothetical protein